MGKNRWSLIFIGLCLALAFSMSPVEAQMHHCEEGNFCDRDGDGFFKDTHQRCDLCIDDDVTSIDFCDDNKNAHLEEECDSLPDPDPDPEPATVTICHFKATSKHCLELGVPTGGVSTIKTNLASIARHVEHGGLQ